MMELIPQKIAGVYAIKLFHAGDARGMFVKTFHAPTLAKFDLQTRFDESFYSTNNRGVIRGMHFQTPPHDHEKIVYCTSGKLIDVIVDLRKNSATYGQHCSIELSGNNYTAAYLPKGVAHGFCVLEDNTCMVYLTSTPHAPTHDTGIRFDSFGFDWPIKNGIHSKRDLEFPILAEFESPF